MSDLRFAIRQLLKHPGFTAIAVITLALGIGANTSMFSMLNATLFPRISYPDSARLVRVYRTSPQSQTWSHSCNDFLNQREQNQVFSLLAAWHWEGFNFGSTAQAAERLTAVHATADLFPMLGAQPVLGRVFSAEETQPGHDPVAILGHGFWMSHFAGDTNILGRTLHFDGEPVVVIGVMPSTFDCPMLWGNVEAWRPLVITSDDRANVENRFLSILGRLKPGVSFTQARTEMSAIADRLAREHPDHDAGTGVRLMTLARSLQPDGSRQGTWFLLGLTSFVLLIACANLTNLQLARMTLRAREFAVRAALGASRSRLMRQLLTENLLISLLGGGLGLLFDSWCNHLLGRWFAPGLDVPLDLRVMGFALACCLVAVFAFGSAPAWLAARADVNQRLKEQIRGATSSGSQRRFQNLLIIGEVALALMLLAGAGTTLRLLLRFARLDPGWNADDLLTAELSVPRANYPTGERRNAFFAQLEERAAALRDVQSVSFTTDLPILSFWNTQPLRIGDRPPLPRDEVPVASCPTVGSAYFQTLGIRLRQGRFFTSADTLERPLVVIINEALAGQFGPGQSPLGKRISLGDPTQPQWREIVGVVSDVRFPADVGNPDTRLQVYRPWAQDDIALGGMIVLRTAAPPASTVEGLRRVVAEMDPDLPVYSVTTVRQRIDLLMRGNYLVAGLLGAFGGLGLVLAGVGIYGVTSYSMAQRTAELGIRAALGAQKHDVLWLVLRQGLSLGVIGALLGLGGSFVVLRLLDRVIPIGSPVRDPMRVAGVPAVGWAAALVAAVVLIAVALLACSFPARRATKVDPMEALRYE